MLKRILVYLAWPMKAEQFVPVIESCRALGITMHFDMWPLEGESPKPKAVEPTVAEPEEPIGVAVCHETGTVSAQDTLYVLDHPDASAYFAGLPQVIFLHEENRNLAFPGTSYLMEQPEELDAVYFERIYRRFHQLPWEILETERLRVRETTVEDVQAFFRIYRDPEITRYMEDLYPTVEEEEQYQREYQQMYRFYEHGIWTVLDKETGEIVGRAGIAVREGYDEPEIGFVIARPHWGKGYAYEVLQAILQYGETYFGYRSFLAFVHPENKRSLQLCGKLGFRIIGETKLSQEDCKDHLMLQLSL